MALFTHSSGKLQPIKEIPFKLEKEVQELTETNLEKVFGLKFISTEFPLNNFRIDTLAFDEESRAFVIIEYKRDRSFSVIDQGYSYLSLMLNNKADFILEYNEKMKDNLKRDDVDWSQSRVVFVANSFTTYQQNAINFKDLPIELWEAKRYDNGSILYNQLKAPDSNESINTVSKSKTVTSVSKEVKKYSMEDHFKGGREGARELFEELKSKVLEIDSRIEVKITKIYIGFQINGLNVGSVEARKNGLRLTLMRTQPKDIKDPEKKVRYFEKSMQHFNQHMSYVSITNSQDVSYAVLMIQQVLANHFA